MVQYDCTKSGHAFEKMDFEIEVCILFSIVYNLYTSQGSTGAENTRTCQTPKNIQMKKMRESSISNNRNWMHKETMSEAYHNSVILKREPFDVCVYLLI